MHVEKSGTICILKIYSVYKKEFKMIGGGGGGWERRQLNIFLLSS